MRLFSVHLTDLSADTEAAFPMHSSSRHSAVAARFSI